MRKHFLSLDCVPRRQRKVGKGRKHTQSYAEREERDQQMLPMGVKSNWGSGERKEVTFFIKSTKPFHSLFHILFGQFENHIQLSCVKLINGCLDLHYKLYISNDDWNWLCKIRAHQMPLTWVHLDNVITACAMSERFLITWFQNRMSESPQIRPSL